VFRLVLYELVDTDCRPDSVSSPDAANKAEMVESGSAAAMSGMPKQEVYLSLLYSLPWRSVATFRWGNAGGHFHFVLAAASLGVVMSHRILFSALV
jgi:hypothetical protein